MAHYVGLYKWTEAGRKNLKASPDRAEAIAQGAEKLGGKLQTVLYTMGQYDLIAIFEAPNDETIVKIAAMIASQGNVETSTMRAFTPEEFKKLTADLPS